MGLGIPHPEIKILLESNPLKSRISVRRLAVLSTSGGPSGPKPRSTTRPKERRAKKGRPRNSRETAPTVFYMRNLLGWLETRLAQISCNHMKIA